MPRLPAPLAIPLLCSLSLSACGPGEATDTGTSDSTSTSTSESTGEETSTSDPTSTSTETTGDGDGDDVPPGPNDCGCFEDEVCVASADGFCGAGFGYSTSCVSTDQCDGNCSCEDICGEFCVPACDYNDPNVQFWCDGAPAIPECDMILQDCAEGEKCVPYASEGGTLDKHRCVSILGDDPVGTSCQGNPNSGEDNCGEDSFCFVGLCEPFCTPEASCSDPGFACIGYVSGVYQVCSQICDPLDPLSCPEMAACTPTFSFSEEPFACLTAPGQKLQGETCNFINECGAGLTCVAAEMLDECQGGWCCSAYCELGDPEACAGLDPLTCASLFEPDPAPAGLESIGACKLN